MAADSRLLEQYTELAELAGRLVHELKNHLGTLSLNLQLLTEDLEKPETPRERRALQRAQKLFHECQRLTDLSTDFLRFAQVRELNRQPTPLKNLIDEMVDFYGPSARQQLVDINVFIPANLPALALDRDAFKQAILNLLLNATQAMPKGGTVTIQAEARDGEVQLSVIDTGAGIAADALPRIFQPFFSTRAGGSGLGLPTTRKIIESHGGRIEAQSEPMRGTKFTITLPVGSS